MQARKLTPRQNLQRDISHWIRLASSLFGGEQGVRERIKQYYGPMSGMSNKGLQLVACRVKLIVEKENERRREESNQQRRVEAFGRVFCRVLGSDEAAGEIAESALNLMLPTITGWLDAKEIPEGALETVVPAHAIQNCGETGRLVRLPTSIEITNNKGKIVRFRPTDKQRQKLECPCDECVEQRHDLRQLDRECAEQQIEEALQRSLTETATRLAAQAKQAKRNRERERQDRKATKEAKKAVENLMDATESRHDKPLTNKQKFEAAKARLFG